MATDPDAALHRAQPGKYRPGAALPPNRPRPEDGTLADTVERMPELAPVRATTAPIEDPPGFGAVFDASTSLAHDDIASVSENRIAGEGYAPIIEALGLPAGENPAHYAPRPPGGAILMTRPSRLSAAQGRSWWDSQVYREDQEELVAAEIRRHRVKDKDFLKGVPDTVEGLRQRFLEERQAKRHAEQGVVARSQGVAGTAASLLGSIYGGAADPFNLATLPIGGGGKTIVQTIFRETLVNGMLEAAEQPSVALQRREFGETLSLGEAVTNTVTAGIGGGVIEGGIKGVGKGVSALDARLGASSALADRIYAAMPERLQKKWDRSIVQSWSTRLADGEKLDEVFGELNNRELSAMSRAIVGEGKLTPDEQAAGHVLERAQDIGETSPYERGPAGDAAHEQGLAEALQALEDGTPVPDHVADPGADPSSAPERPPEGQSTARRPQGMAALAEARLPADIYDGLKARGIPDHIARGAAAGSFAEAAAGASALNPKSGAMGIGQWLGPRKAELIRRYGQHPNLDQQLDFLAWELKGGDAGGAAVLAAKDEVGALDAYVRKFMRPAAGAETDGDLNRGMAALGRKGEGLPADMAAADYARADDPAIARLKAEALQLDDQMVGLTRRPDGSTVIAGSRSVPSSRILVDAERFQFKSGGDQFGVSDRLKGVTEFDPILSGRVILWEQGDGKLFVADGHQRVGLAKRISATSGKDVPIDAIVLREADGVSPEDARVMAAIKNIAEGTGSAVDAAKVLRDAPGLAGRLPPRSALVRDGGALARLSDDAFGAVYNGVIEPDIAAVIGHLAPDRPELHAGLVELLVKLDPASRGQADSIVRQALEAGFHRETQDELFGAREMIQPLMLERAKVLEKGLAKIRKLGLVHRTAAREKVTLEATGSHIAAERSAREAQANDQAAEILQRLAFRGGPVADALNAAARDLAGGGNPGSVVDKFIGRVRELDLAALDRGGLEPGGSGRGSDAGEAGEEVRSSADSPPEQPSLEDLQAATERFSDPDGTAVQQQADSLVHDFKATIESGVDTRGMGVQLHGARGEVPDLTEGHYNPNNIYGGFETFYTTDAADIAGGYRRKNPDGRIYQVTEKAPVKFFDMEEDLPRADLDRLFGDDDLAGMAIEEAQQGGKAKLREVMDEMRDLSQGEGISKDEVQEIFDGAIVRLSREGFGGMTHVGGLKTGREPHTVKIYFDAPNQLELKDVTPGKPALDRGAAVDPATAERQRQEIALRAASPLRPGDVDAKGEIGLSLFDQADQLGIHLGDEGRSLLDELDADDKAIKAIKDCL